MGRRQRHFNPVHAGAGMCLDARYLTGFGNGANVTTWPSRPGVTFAFTNTSNYPTFLDSVAAAANQPGVDFVSGSSQRLQNVGTPVIPDGSTTFTVVEFSTGGSGFIPFIQTSAATGIALLFNGANYCNVLMHRGYFEFRGSTAQTLNEGAYGNGIVNYAKNDGTSQTARNGLETVRSRTSSGSVRNVTTTAPAIGQYRTGVLHSVSAFATALDNSIIRRIMDSYAFSYKSAM